MRKYLIGGLAAAALLAAWAPPAQAAPVCREARVVGVYVVTACVEQTVYTGLAGATVAPRVTITCVLDTDVTADPCTAPVTISMMRTGFVPSTTPPPLILDPATGSVGIGDGSLGTVWYRGAATPVNIGRTCVGDPAVC